MGYLTFIEVISKNDGISKKLWYKPVAIDCYRGALILEDPPLASNIGYSLQYLEYIQLQLDELWLTDPIAALLRKTYVVTSISIIEALFVYLLKSTDNWFAERFIEIDQKATNIYTDNDKKRQMKIITLEKRKPSDTDIDFETIINRISEKRLIGFPYGRMKQLKRIRNKIHLQNAKKSSETDYNSFTKDVYIEAKYYLYEIITSEIFTNNVDAFKLFKLNEDEELIMKKIK